jgi:hypothetical protein
MGQLVPLQRGKCFTTAAAGETVVPTDAEGKLLTEADAVPLLSRIINRLDESGLPSVRLRILV